MGPIERFDIVLDKNRAFCPGETVTGKVTIVLSDDMHIKGIGLNIFGRAYVIWSGFRKDNSDSFTSQEVYLDGLKTLAVALDTPSITLSKGKNVYPFDVNLPEECPSSLHIIHALKQTVIDHGNIEYSVTATIHKFPSDTEVRRKIIPVINLLDLNDISDTQRTVHDSSTTVMCCQVWDAGFVETSFQLDKTGYIPGEMLRVKVHIINQSRSYMRTTKLQLHMKVKYFGENQDGVASGDLTILLMKSRKKWDPVAPRTVVEWVDDSLVLPPLPPSGTPHCTCIDIQYYVTVAVGPGGPSGRLDFTVGGVPLDSVAKLFSIEYPPEISDEQTIDPQKVRLSYRCNPNLGVREDSGHITPLYPYYDIQAHPQNAPKDSSPITWN